MRRVLPHQGAKRPEPRPPRVSRQPSKLDLPLGTSSQGDVTVSLVQRRCNGRRRRPRESCDVVKQGRAPAARTRTLSGSRFLQPKPSRFLTEKVAMPLRQVPASCPEWRFTRWNWLNGESPCRSRRSSTFRRNRHYCRHHRRSNRSFTSGRSRVENRGRNSTGSERAIASSPNLRFDGSTPLHVCRSLNGIVQRPCQTRTLLASTGSLGSP
jgi:hypothetical protein